MIDTLPHDQLVRMVVTAWAIWHARWKAIHEDLFQSPLSTHHFVESFLRDLQQSSKSNTVDKQAPGRSPSHPRWVKPPSGVTKLNVDAGLAKTRRAGAVAAIARSDEGVFLGASAVVFHAITDPETLEAMAVREGLNLALDLNLSKIRVASDCSSVVVALQEVNLGKYSHVLQEIKAVARDLSEVVYVHENRRSNKEPYDLAQFVSSLPVGRYTWLVNLPEGVCIPHIIS
jgi:ribonuclease HI